MSSTNRSNHRNSHRDDYYQTPSWCIEEFMKSFLDTICIGNLSEFSILDPCAGGDDDHVAAYPNALVKFGAEAIDTMDIRAESRANIIGDFLSDDLDLDKKYDMVISNPPFNLAKDFVDRGLEVVEKGGFVIYLLRVSFLGSQKRKPWWKENMPSYIFVHSKRPSFTNGGTDSAEYAHFVWEKGERPEFAKIKHA